MPLGNWTRFVAAVVGGFLTQGLVADLLSQDGKTGEIRAAIMCQLALRTEWPADCFEDEESHFRIVLVGRDDEEIEANLSRFLSGRKIAGRGVEIITMRGLEQESAGLLHEAHLACFLSERSGLDEKWVKLLCGQQVLSMGCSKRFMNEGGMVSVAFANHRSDIWVNMEALNRCGFKISSEALRHAKVYEDGEREEQE